MGTVVTRTGARPALLTSYAALRGAAGTPPGRLRLAGLVLALLALGFGALAGWQLVDRAQAADQVVSRSEPLSQDAAEIYRSLADADTTAATGFLLAGDEPAAVRDRYQNDLQTAARLLAQASARTTASSEAQQSVAQLTEQLPVYAGLVETARADNRLGLPLGGAYLRYASDQMQKHVLPAAQTLVDAQSARLEADYRDATSPPWAAYGLALVAVAALVRYQVLLLRRTNRVFNLGLLGATAAVLAAAAWLAVGGLGATHALDQSRSAGARPLRALDQARTDVLQARTAENLDLVARGATGEYADKWTTTVGRLSGGELASARALAPTEATPELAQAATLFTTWQSRHDAAARSSNAGDFDAALKATVGGTDTSDAAFAALDGQLAKAAVAEQDRFATAAKGVGAQLTALAVVAAVAAVLAALGVFRGIGRRVAEYR